MKTKYILVPLIVSLLGCSNRFEYTPRESDSDVNYDNVYLIMGQSNASGVSQYQYLESYNLELYQRYMEGNSKVLISYDVDNRIEKNYIPTRFGLGNNETFFGPEIGIAEVLGQNEETSYIIKATYSGSCLLTQYVDEQGNCFGLYFRFITFIKNQLKALEKEGKNPRLRGLFWMQGESDSFQPQSWNYKKAEENFLFRLKCDLNNWIYDHFNFVDAYIHTRGICWVNPEIINQCKQEIADENEHCYCIKTNGEDNTAITLNLKSDTGEDENDLAHYDSKSMLLLGQTAGEYLIK